MVSRGRVLSETGAIHSPLKHQLQLQIRKSKSNLNKIQKRPDTAYELLLLSIIILQLASAAFRVRAENSYQQVRGFDRDHLNQGRCMLLIVLFLYLGCKSASTQVRRISLLFLPRSFDICQIFKMKWGNNTDWSIFLLSLIKENLSTLT